MKIRVTLICLLCSSIVADRKNADTALLTSSNSNFSPRKEIMKKFVPKRRVYEYFRSIEAAQVDLRNKNGSSQARVIEPMNYSESIEGAGLPNNLSGSLGEQAARSLQQLATVRINSKQPSEIFEVEFSSPEEKVLSRKKKDQMEQAVLALLMAYKMKFTALIPIMLGGISLLISTTALAGFFFALFAAVLGLKAH